MCNLSKQVGFFVVSCNLFNKATLTQIVEVLCLKFEELCDLSSFKDYLLLDTMFIHVQATA